MSGRLRNPGESVLERAQRLLEAFPSDGEPVTVADLARATGLPVSTVHRIVRQLTTLGQLDAFGDRYAIGTRLWELGERAPLARRLREASLPALTDLYDATGENAQLAVLVDRAVLYLAKATGARAIPTLSRVGVRHPPHATAPGRAMLAGLDEAELAPYLAGPLPALTRYTITDRDALRSELERTRGRGYAVARQEVTLGNVSIAIALRPRAGLPRAALGLVCHLAAEEARLVPLLRRAVAAVELELDRTESHSVG